MRTVNPHLLVEKIDEAVTHYYINSQPTSEGVHIDANALALNVQDDPGGRVVTVMHSQNVTSQMCRQVLLGDQISDGTWGEELLDPDGRLAAIVANLTQHSRSSHHQPVHHKVSSIRTDVDSSVMLDNPMRLFNGQTLDQPGEVVLPSLPPLQEMKRCQEADWFSKSKAMKANTPILAEPDSLELSAVASPALHKQQSKKSLPHKKRISRKLKRNTGNCTPQQDLVVLNGQEEVQQEEILPDNFVSEVHHQEQLPDDAHHIAHGVRSVFICQLCGEYYGEEQFKFFQHLKQHYEPQATIIIENPVPDLGIDKMTNTCIVDNVSTLPDSIVELSLDNTVAKSIYHQPMDKHILYTSSDKTLNYTGNRLQYSMAHMDKEPSVVTSEMEKGDLYDVALDKLDLYSCNKCNKSFKKQRHCEAHIKEVHSNSKLEVMSDFSEPEDLMEGIHVSVEDAEQYDPALMPHITVDNGHVHQDHVRHWYMRNVSASGGALSECGADDGYGCTVCPAPPPAPVPVPTPAPAPPPLRDLSPVPANAGSHLKEEVLQRILDSEVVTEEAQTYTENMIPEQTEVHQVQERTVVTEVKDAKNKKKSSNKFECLQCKRVFGHRNSLLYHVLSHKGKQHICRECGKEFYTSGALKIHKRVHNGDRPYKCDQCDREFRQWSDLKYHKVSLHSDQRHYKCDYCGKDFARKYSLNLHRRIHTGEKNYKCEYCNKTFRASSYRHSHMRTHTGEKPYKCEECNKCFRVVGDLRRHEQIHEKERMRIEELNKLKNDSKSPKLEAIGTVEVENTVKGARKHVVPSTKKLPTINKNTDKKQGQKSKKPQIKKLAAPNVTVNNQNKIDEGQFEYHSDNMDDVFDTRQATSYGKFKEICNSSSECSKVKDNYINDEQSLIGEYKNSKLLNERDFATLRPMFRSNVPLCDNIENSKPVYSRVEYTDGKMSVYNHVEKEKDYSDDIVTNSQVLTDMRHLERDVPRDVRHDALNGEASENNFLERLTAMYNISAV